MKLTFIGQGVDPKSDAVVGHYIIDSLESKNYNAFNAYVAFVSTGGLHNIIDQILAFKKSGGDIKLFVGVDLNGTSKEALDLLLKEEIESYIIYSPNSIIFHPKIYSFEGKKSKRTIIGSSNLTEGGLFQNIEASVCIDFNSEDEVGNAFLADIYDHFNSIIQRKDSSCQILNKEILNLLVKNKIVLTESQNKAKRKKTASKVKDSKSKEQLLKLFGKLNKKRPPKGFRNQVTKQKFILEGKAKKVKIEYEELELDSGSMWIETGRMTGGSRNILDLSMKGKLKGELKFGSVSYFGVNPDNKKATKDINIIFGGKVYRGNHIFYAEGNSNWRIRINGISDDGEKITTFSKPSLGRDGGFQNKILLFTKIDKNNFNLEILEKAELNNLIDNSSVWARGGNETTGRAYGIVK